MIKKFASGGAVQDFAHGFAPNITFLDSMKNSVVWPQRTTRGERGEPSRVEIWSAGLVRVAERGFLKTEKPEMLI